jgi:polysaccharide biosynthesis transport protein
MTWQSAGRAILRYKWLALGLTAALVILTGVIVSSQTPTYEATTQVRIQQRVPVGEVPALEIARQNAEAYSVIVSGTRFADLVKSTIATAIPDLTIPEIRGAISSEPVPGTDLLNITVTGTDPGRIAQIANATPDALRAFAKIEATEQIVPISEAGVPSSPVSPKVNLAIAVALVIGLIINGALMVLLDLLRDRFANADELRAATGKPVLAMVPRLQATRPTPQRERSPRAARSRAEKPAEPAPSRDLPARDLTARELEGRS